MNILLSWLYSSPGRIQTLLFFFATILMIIVGPPMISWLRNKQWRRDAETWMEREDTPDTHRAKRGTPSMGGIGIIGVAVVTYLTMEALLMIVSQYSIANNPSRPFQFDWISILRNMLIPPFAVGTHALLGFGDDWSKATGRGGLRARTKLIVQTLLVIGVLLAWSLSLVHRQNPYLTQRTFETFTFLKSPQLLIVTLCVVAVLIMGTCNATNLTDGIDGLAAGLAVPAFLGLAILGFDLSIRVIGVRASWMSASLAGACLGFLYYNKHKAKVFMGDTGSLALGAALAIFAVFERAVFLLPFIAFIYYIEMFSVMLQVAYFKWTKHKTGEGKRIFRRAPLHHHFELGGWSEWRVVATFWAINLVTTGVGLALWYSGVLPRWP